jgi:hypothetical protein
MADKLLIVGGNGLGLVGGGALLIVTEAAPGRFATVFAGVVR